MLSKQIIEHHFVLGYARIHIPLKTITADKRQLYRLSSLRFLHKTDDFVSQNLLVILIDGKLTFRKLHFAKIDGIVTTLYHHVYLSCPLRRPGITLASPGIQLGSHTGNTQPLLHLVDMIHRQYLERNSSPGIKTGRALQLAPIQKITERTIAQETEIEQGEEIYQLIERLSGGTAKVDILSDETAGFQIVENRGQRFARLHPGGIGYFRAHHTITTLVQAFYHLDVCLRILEQRALEHRKLIVQLPIGIEQQTVYILSQT